MITLAPNVYVAKYLKATGKMCLGRRRRTEGGSGGIGMYVFRDV